jgi:hypothetical protein
VAAAVTSGALPVTPQALPAAAAHHEAALAATRSVWLAPAPRAYLSQGPPLTSL